MNERKTILIVEDEPDEVAYLSGPVCGQRFCGNLGGQRAGGFREGEGASIPT